MPGLSRNRLSRNDSVKDAGGPNDGRAYIPRRDDHRLLQLPQRPGRGLVHGRGVSTKGWPQTGPPFLCVPSMLDGLEVQTSSQRDSPVVNPAVVRGRRSRLPPTHFAGSEALSNISNNWNGVRLVTPSAGETKEVGDAISIPTAPNLDSNFHDRNLEPDGGCYRQVAHPRNHPNVLSRSLCILCAKTGLPSLPVKGSLRRTKRKVAGVAI